MHVPRTSMRQHSAPAHPSSFPLTHPHGHTHIHIHPHHPHPLLPAPPVPIPPYRARRSSSPLPLILLLPPDWGSFPSPSPFRPQQRAAKNWCLSAISPRALLVYYKELPLPALPCAVSLLLSRPRSFTRIGSSCRKLGNGPTAPQDVHFTFPGWSSGSSRSRGWSTVE